MLFKPNLSSFAQLQSLKKYCLLLLLAIPAINAAEFDFQLSNSVVKVVAKSENNRTQLGSGVVIDHNLVATNCHTLKLANSAYLLKAGRRYLITAQAALPELDTCILQTETMELPFAKLTENKQLKPGDPIIMFGYPLALGIRSLQGSIKALHPHNSDQVIEINTGFIQGASGGGVFSQHGKLIGLATFMTRGDDNLHFFVIPSAWITLALKQPFEPVKPFKTKSFWENGRFHYN